MPSFDPNSFPNRQIYLQWLNLVVVGCLDGPVTGAKQQPSGRYSDWIKGNNDHERAARRARRGRE